MTADRPTADPRTTAAALLDYPIAERTLANGLRVIVSADHAAPVVAVNIWYDVGSRHEVAGRTGLAHLFEHIMFQGSANVGSGEHIAALQSVGASVNATTWFDRTNYFAALPTGGLELVLWLEADRMATLLDALTQENLDNQRDVVKEEKRQRYDNVPYGDVMQRLVALTFPVGHPYAHTTIGSMDDLDAASLADTHAFFRSSYMPNNAVLSIVGDCEAERGFDLAERYFGQIAAQPLDRSATPSALSALTGLPRDETAAVVPADAVYLTWRLPVTGTPAFDAIDLAMTVLGHGQTSRLHQRLVRSDELAEGAGASALGLVGGSSFGYAYARCRDQITPEQLESELLIEVDRLITTGPTRAELDLAKAQFERQWLQQLARVDSRADQLSGHKTLHGDANLINTRIAQIASVDRDAVQAAAAQHLAVDQRATLIYRQATTEGGAA